MTTKPEFRQSVPQILRFSMALLSVAAIAALCAGCGDTGGEAGAGAPAPPGSPGPLWPRDGENAPGFALKDLSGKTVSLSDYHGKANVLLHFGTTWCPPCGEQVPKLKELDEKYGADELVILSVHIDESAAAVGRFVQNEKAQYATLLDDEGAVAGEYGVEFIPHNVLVDKAGRIAGDPSNEIPEEGIRGLVGR
ncbi:MAG: TlpA family protein disulfide reductase [Planctomycetota bacterium]|jgi:peroxiredoxin